MNDVILSIQHVSKNYGEAAALKDINVEIKRGEIYGLVGNNGAGKSTLMRIISGQAEASSGQVALFGAKTKSELQKSRRRTGVLIEDPGFYHNMSAAQNLEYFRIQFGIPGKECVAKVLEEVGLGKVGSKKYKGFSLGMKQRLGIALALLASPELLILDEPINGLDPAGIIEVRQTLLEINKKRRTTILISSHILSELEHIATRYGFLSHGELLEDLSAAELLTKCEAYLDITVENTKAMCLLLEKELKLFNYKVYANNHIHLYEGLDQGEGICEIAVKHHLGLTGIEKKTQSLETYYMNIVEGERYA